MDQSIVFDGAWRLLCGQWFIEDFKTPVGFVPILMQAAFFKVLGVNWTAFCVHAAVLNGLFTLLVFYYLKWSGSKLQMAVYFAALSTVVFYAPMATPFPDQHAFFFSFACIVAVLGTSHFSGTKRTLLWLFVPILGMLALLSKHIPSAFLLIGAAVLVLVQIAKGEKKPAFFGLGIGAVLASLLVLLVFPIARLQDGSVWETVVSIPMELGQGRMDETEAISLVWIRNLYLRPFQVLTSHNFWDSVLVLLPIVFVPLAWLVPKVRRTIDLIHESKLVLVLVLVHVSSAQFIRLTGNQEENGIPFIFLAIGLAVTWLLNSKIPATLFSRKTVLVRSVSLVFCAILVATSGWEAIQFNMRVNETRKVLDTEFIHANNNTVTLKEHGFDGLLYNAAWHHGSLRPDSLVMFLKATDPDDSVLLWGDMNLVYGLSGKEPVSSVLWLHAGLTLPDTLSNSFPAFADEFSDHIINADPRFVVFEHHSRSTSAHVRWRQFPRLEEWLQKSVIRTEFVGGFEVFHLKE